MALSKLLIQAHEQLAPQTQKLFVASDKSSKKIILFFSISDGKRRAKVGQVTGQGFSEVWAKGAAWAQRAAERNKISVRWLRIDWVTSAKEMTWAELGRHYLAKSKRSYFRYGISLDAEFKYAFLEQELNGNAMLYKGAKVPVAQLNENNFLRYARIKYGANTEVDFGPSTSVWMFATQGIFVENDERLAHIPGHGQPQWLSGPGRDGGRRQIEQLNADQVYDLIVSASTFLARQVHATGKFVYGYFPCFGRTIPTYNTLRHASTIYSMVEAYELTRDPTLFAAIQRALNYLAEHIIRHYPQEDGSTVAYNVDIGDEIKLGANAVSLLALVKYTEVTQDDQYYSLMESLALGIARMQDSVTGKFVHVLNAADLSVKEEYRTIYYDGEAAFGLIRLYGLTQDPRWLVIVEKGFEYFLAAEHWKAHDHWLSYCANELTLYKPEEKYFRFGVKNIAGYLDFIIERITTFPTLLELSMAFQNMLERIKGMPEMIHVLDGFDEEKFYRALHHRAHYLLNGFFWPEFAMFYSRPSQIVGSFFIRHHAFRVRIDDVEHYLSGYIAYWKMLTEQQKEKNKNIENKAFEKKNYYFCNVNFSRYLTGVEHASINRANLFVEHLNIVPTMLTMSLNLDIQIIWQNLKKIGLVRPEIPLLNLYEEVMQINLGAHLPAAQIKYDHNWKVSNVPNTPTPHQRVRHPNGEMRMYIVWRDNEKTIPNYINYFYAGKKIQRDKFNRFGQLAVTQYLGDKERVLKEDCYTPKGQRCMSRSFDQNGRIRLIQWFDADQGAYLCFDSEVGLGSAWLKKKFHNDPHNVFIIDKNRTWAESLHELNQDTPQQLISVIHSYHLRSLNQDLKTGDLNRNYSGVLNNKFKVNQCVVLTAEQQEDFKQRFINRDYEVHCIPHAYEGSEVATTIERDQDLLVMVARLSPEKRVQDAIQIMSLLHKKYPDKRLEIYGSGPERVALQRLIEELGLEQVVRLKGYTHDIAGVFSRAAVSLLTSRAEGFSLSILESLAHGCPVLAYDIKYGPATLITHGQSGWLVPYRDMEAAAQILINYFSHADHLSQFSQAAYAEAQRFHPTRIASYWQQLLAGIMAKETSGDTRPQ